MKIPIIIILAPLMLQVICALKMVSLDKSYGHKNKGLKMLAVLNPQIHLTITIVTGTWTNTRVVSEYYSSFKYLKIFEKSSMHFKMKGSVSRFSRVFKTFFKQYECPYETRLICFATTSQVSVPSFLKRKILGIIGLEQILSLKPNLEVLRSKNKLVNSFLPPQVAQIYGFPKSNGAGIRVGVVSLGGYFNQTDLQNYFDQFDLGEAPTINIALINGLRSPVNSILHCPFCEASPIKKTFKLKLNLAKPSLENKINS